MAAFDDLFAKYVGVAFAKQLAFADMLGDRGWGVDITSATATFGDDLKFPIQLVGSEADGNASWLWAWANSGSNFPNTILKACHAIRDYGEKHNIEELTARGFPLDVANGHMLSMVASGMIKKCCYYRGPYDGGAVFFLVMNPPEQVLAPVDSPRAITVITETLSQFDVDHRVMAQSFLKYQGFATTLKADALQASRDGDTLTLELDEQHRITNITGNLNSSGE